MSEVRFLNDFTGYTTGTKYYHTPFGVIADVIRVAEITSTAATTWNLIERSGQGDRADVSSAGILVPNGAGVISIGLRIPSTTRGGTASGLVATTNDRLKIATAVANNTRDWTANDGTKCGVVSSVAASSSFAAESVVGGYRIGDDAASVVRLTSDATFKLWNDNGTTALGSGVSSPASTITLVVVRIVYSLPAYVPTVELASAKPAKGVQGTIYVPNF